jgi:hypothetical protein
VTGEEFMELYLGSTELRQYIVDQAKRRSRRKELQEEYVQEAWLAVSCAPGGYCVEAYCELVDKAIYSGYWQQNKNRLMQTKYLNSIYSSETIEEGEDFEMPLDERIDYWHLAVDVHYKMKHKKYGVGEN